jgi:hypothetical protein
MKHSMAPPLPPGLVEQTMEASKRFRMQSSETQKPPA